MEVRYTPGDGVLVARAGRWLLLGPSAPVRPAVLDQLWDDLAQPAARSLALATVRLHLDGTSLAWLDAATGETLAESGGSLTRHGDRVELTVPASRPGSPTATGLRLVEGVVAAAALQVTGAVPLPRGAADPTGSVIDGIPPEILAASAPARPAAYDATPEAAAGAAGDAGAEHGTVTRRPTPGDSDHDRHTRLRAAATTPGPGTAPGHLEQPTSDTVLAVRCGQGHLTDPLGGTCRACGAAVPRQEPQRVLRPPLGVLQLADGGVVPLDRPVVLGRRPAPDGPGDWPHLITLPTDSTYLSRRHLRIDLDGWHVLAEDLASRGGTTIFAPGRDPEKIRPHEPYLLEHGTTLDLAGAYQLTYLSTGPPTSDPVHGPSPPPSPEGAT